MPARLGGATHVFFHFLKIAVVLGQQVIERLVASASTLFDPAVRIDNAGSLQVSSVS